MRQLKRNFTVIGAGGPLAEDVQMSPEPPSPARSGGCLPSAQPLPQLPFPLENYKAQDTARQMDPPLQMPPWKRPSRAVTPSRPSKVPQSPHRMLTPRVSWSDIVSHSQESLDEVPRAPGSPRTPVFRIRAPASPPARETWRRRPPSDDEGDGRDKNEGRLQQEFCDIQAIGKGQFSTVYRAKNRVDQCMYAVKKTTQIARGLRQTQLKEVFALANVSMEAEGCPHIVRYYSSWLEDGRLHIQTELCECSLRDRLQERRKKEPSDPRFAEPELTEVLRHVTSGLTVLHGCGFVHLDIKPDNILVSRGGREKGLYKIADLGLAAAAMGTGCDDVSEGDCRYLAKEVLRGCLSSLPKADVFSLGLVLYELASNPKALPCNGPEWQQIREGRLEAELMASLSEPLIALLHRMVHALPEDRPPCEEIIRHPCVAPEDKMQALREENQKSKEEAARSRQLADEYWHEMMLMKRQELLNGTPSVAAIATPARGSAFFGTRGGTPGAPGATALRRGKTS